MTFLTAEWDLLNMGLFWGGGVPNPLINSTRLHSNNRESKTLWSMCFYYWFLNLKQNGNITGHGSCSRIHRIHSKGKDTHEGLWTGNWTKHENHVLKTEHSGKLVNFGIIFCAFFMPFCFFFCYSHTRIPGYAGHQPMSAINQRVALRESCFSTKWIILKKII